MLGEEIAGNKVFKPSRAHQGSHCMPAVDKEGIRDLFDHFMRGGGILFTVYADTGHLPEHLIFDFYGLLMAATQVIYDYLV